MRRSIAYTLLLALLVLGGSVNAASTLYPFENTDQAERFQELTRQLRCLVCQGESIADSNADLAKDLRSQVHDMIVAGRSNQQIIDFMTNRYGDFILYKPPFAPRTYLLWVAPLLLLLLASAGMIYRVWGSRRNTPSIGLQQAERERLSRLLDKPGKPKTSRTWT